VILDFEMPGMNGFETTEKIKANPEIDDTNIVMMPSYGRRGHAHKAIQSGISAYLIKPIRQVELFDCVTTLMTGVKTSQDQENGFDDVSGLITRHSLLEKRSANGLPILIATDDVKNQGTISMQLELLGYRSELVSDGYEAIAALKRRSYALILLDTEIPGLDGYGTAKKIRNHLLEGTVPIVAITTEPSRKGKKRALEAGMNTYLSMPMSEDELSNTIDELINVNPASRDEKEVAEHEKEANLAPSAESYLKSIAEEFGADMAEMTVSLFTEDASRHIREINSAIENDDSKLIASLCESLQLVCETISATSLQHLCIEIGENAGNGDKSGAAESAGMLNSEFDSIVKRIENLALAPLG
jgi:CheY-like chemotaxis protein/HPt (histidine-containing phosphotransfer) domain-containing protein